MSGTIRKELGLDAKGNEHWVDFIDPDDLTSRIHRKVTNYAITSENGVGSSFLAQRDAVLFFCVTGWSFAAALPTNGKEIDRLALPLKQYKRLCAELEKYMRHLRMDEEDETDADGDVDPQEPSDD